MFLFYFILYVQLFDFKQLFLFQVWFKNRRARWRKQKKDTNNQTPKGFRGSLSALNHGQKPVTLNTTNINNNKNNNSRSYGMDSEGGSISPCSPIREIEKALAKAHWSSRMKDKCLQQENEKKGVTNSVQPKRRDTENQI